MSSSINWTGNKVLNPGASRQAAQPVMASDPMQGSTYSPPFSMQGSAYSPSSPSQQGGGFTPSSPSQQGSAFTPSAPPQQGSAFIPSAPPQQGGFVLPGTQQGPPPSTERGFIPYYLASNMGKSVRAEFIVGSDQYVDKTGIISEVGINYFVLTDVNSRTTVMCDLYSVKFVTILQS